MLYANVRNLCIKKGISVSTLETNLHFSRSSICKWDKNIPNIKKVQAVANYFNVPIESLLDERKE
jgi:transcriptional regulator with XRE-family HTH domain